MLLKIYTFALSDSSLYCLLLPPTGRAKRGREKLKGAPTQATKKEDCRVFSYGKEAHQESVLASTR